MSTSGLQKFQYDDSWQYQAEPKTHILLLGKKVNQERVTPLVRNLPNILKHRYTQNHDEYNI